MRRGSRGGCGGSKINRQMLVGVLRNPPITATCRHSRESGNPFAVEEKVRIKMDPRFRGDDGFFGMCNVSSLLPPGEGGAKRRMRVGHLSTSLQDPTLTPTPLPEERGSSEDLVGTRGEAKNAYTPVRAERSQRSSRSRSVATVTLRLRAFGATLRANGSFT